MHVIPQVRKTRLAHPMVTSALLVLACGRVPLVLNIEIIAFGEFGPTTSAMVVIPISPRAFPAPPLERSSLEVPARLDAPLLICIHDAMISFGGARGPAHDLAAIYAR